MHKEVISDPGNEMQFFAHQVAFLLTYRAVQNQSSRHTRNLRRQSHVLSALGTEKGSQPWPLSGHDAASLLTALPPGAQGAPVSEDMLSSAKCSQSEVSRCLIWYFPNPVLNITVTANRICFHYPINEAQKLSIL